MRVGILIYEYQIPSSNRNEIQRQCPGVSLNMIRKVLKDRRWQVKDLGPWQRCEVGKDRKVAIR